MSGLTKDDLQVVKGDARISDIRIQEALGYADLQHLHKIIRRHSGELEAYGEVYTQSVRKSGPGRPALNFLLNEEQALLVCMFARTAKAHEARRQIVEVFLAWRRGDLQSAIDAFWLRRDTVKRRSV